MKCDVEHKSDGKRRQLNSNEAMGVGKLITAYVSGKPQCACIIAVEY